jgi:hypothetical protein
MRYQISPIVLATLAGSYISNAVAQPDKPFPAEFELSSLDGIDGFVLNGVGNYFTGESVSAAGDVNGDGVDDLIIGARRAAPNGNLNAGESYVVFGRVGIGSSGAVDLSMLDGTNGFVLEGISVGDYTGDSVSCAGDVNGDGIDDMIIGAYLADPDGNSSAGKSYVVFGGNGVGSSGAIELSSLDGSNGFVVNGADAGDQSGCSVSSAGDVNGDGVADLIIGAIRADPNGNASAGEGYVVFGDIGVGSSGELDLSTLSGTNGFVINGISVNDRSGRSVSSAGDVNGDGVDDLIIGANLADPQDVSAAGESYVVFGGAGVGSSGVVEAGMLSGTDGFMLNGIANNDQSGGSVSSAGDVNGDGVDDLLIGAGFADQPMKPDAGGCYVVFGGIDVGASGVINLAEITSVDGIVIKGIDSNDQSGGSVSSAGDVNGDGIIDLIIGADRADPNGKTAGGESYVVFGSIGVSASGSIELSSLDGTNGFIINGIDAEDRSGISVSSAGDVNGDGVDDVIIGAFWADLNGMSQAGESYVIFGRDLSPCTADTNGDGTLTPTDFTAWINAFNNNLPECDQNSDSNCTPTDFTAWIANYNTGCD